MSISEVRRHRSRGADATEVSLQGEEWPPATPYYRRTTEDFALQDQIKARIRANYCRSESPEQLPRGCEAGDA